MVPFLEKKIHSSHVKVQYLVLFLEMMILWRPEASRRDLTLSLKVSLVGRVIHMPRFNVNDYLKFFHTWPVLTEGLHAEWEIIAFLIRWGGFFFFFEFLLCRSVLIISKHQIKQ